MRKRRFTVKASRDARRRSVRASETITYRGKVYDADTVREYYDMDVTNYGDLGANTAQEFFDRYIELDPDFVELFKYDINPIESSKSVKASRYGSEAKFDLYDELRKIDFGFGDDSSEISVSEDVDEVIYSSNNELQRIIGKKGSIVEIIENGSDSQAEEMIDAMKAMSDAIHRCHMAIVNGK